MKKRYIALLVLVCFLLFWIGSMAVAGVLTALHGHEFTDFAKLNAGWLDNYGEDQEIRVISYTSEKAKVYFYSKDGGDYLLFVKENGQWKCKETIANWSGVGGSADDYFIWPYFKHYVP